MIIPAFAGQVRVEIPITLNTSGIPVQAINDPFLSEAGVHLSVLRLDRVHPAISGNKWFKLKYNLERARRLGHATLLSFGGPWSNHLHALAHAGREFGFNTIGIVRGELPVTLTPCLKEAEAAGMTLAGIARGQFAQKSSEYFIESLRQQFGDFYLIPEGGANREGALGCAEIATLINQDDVDVIAMACGTGTMLAGMASGSTTDLLGFQVLKGDGYIERQVLEHWRQFEIIPLCNWSINDQYHFGGYARVTKALITFIENFQSLNSIALEPVYSGKMLCGLYSLIKRDFFPQNSRILAIHGGGLQGRRGFKEFNC